MAVCRAAASPEQSWGSCKGLGRVGRGGGRGAHRGGGDGGEDLLHQGPCSSDCHHLSLLAPIQRTQHSSHGLTGGEWCWNKQEEKKEGVPGAPGEQPSLRLWPEPDQGRGPGGRGALRQG